MFVVSRICTLLFLLSIPTAIGFALTRLLAGRRGNPDPAPFRNRLYSGLKRMACAWCIEIVLCAIAFVVLGCWNPGMMLHGEEFLSLIGVAILAFAWGVVWPRTYADGIDRVKSGRRLAWGLLAFYLFFVLSVAFMAVNGIAGLGFKGHDSARKFFVKRPCYRPGGKFRVAGSVADRMIPPRATDIEFSYSPGLGGVMGANAELCCRVEKDALLAFAKDQGYAFRSDSYTFNACADGPQDCGFIHWVWEKYNPSGEKTYPKEFLAYNYRYASCGGYSFFYDVKAKVLYAAWASN